MTLYDTLYEIEERWKPLEEKEADVTAEDAAKQKEVAASSLQELRVRVAELCGATWGHPVYAHDMKWHVHLGNPPFEFDSSWAGKPPAFECCWKDIDVPDYCNDLNACEELIDMIRNKGWNCDINNGLDGTWECLFLKRSYATNGDEHVDASCYGAHAKLCTAICIAFVAVMEASDRPGADSVSDVTESSNASRASSPKDSLSPEIVIPALCKAVRRQQEIIFSLNENPAFEEEVASILEKKDA